MENKNIKTSIDWQEAFKAQQATISYFIYQVMENEIEYPKWKNNLEKNRWFNEKLLTNKYDYLK